MRQRLRELRPRDEETARAMQPLVALLPLLTKLLPDDPEEIDRYLEMIAWGCTQCRSDDSPALQLFVLEENPGDVPGWRAVSFEHD